MHEVDITEFTVEELIDFMVSEEFQQLDELSKQTLGRYINKAATSRGWYGMDVGSSADDSKSRADSLKMMKKRSKGIATAVSKLTKEEKDSYQLPNRNQPKLVNESMAEGHDTIHGKEPKKGTLAHQIWSSKVKKDKKSPVIEPKDEMSGVAKIVKEEEKKTSESSSSKMKEDYVLEDFTLDEIVEFMVSEEFQQLDELSKQTLGRYINKAAQSATGLATTAMHHKSTERDWDKKASEMKAMDNDIGVKYAKKMSNEFHKHSFNATNKNLS